MLFSNPVLNNKDGPIIQDQWKSSVAAILKLWDLGKLVFVKKCEKNKLTGIKNQNSWPNWASKKKKNPWLHLIP